MKKSAFYVSLIVVLLGIGYRISELSIDKFDGFSDLALNNIEALAFDESDTQNDWCCGNTGVCVKGPDYEIKGKLSDSPCSK